MTWHTHLLGGMASLWGVHLLSAGTVSTSLFPSPTLMVTPELAGAALISAAIGSLFPDLDASQSHLSNLQIGTERIMVRPFALIAAVLNRALGHRGLLHSLVGLAICTCLISIPLALSVSPEAGLAFTLSYTSHLLLDACTKRGIRLLYPQVRKFYLLPLRLRITTDAPEEGIVFALLVVPTLLLLYLPGLF